jgi:hypothetical protein
MMVRSRALKANEWRRSLSIRKYEWIAYALAAVTGGAWGGLSLGLMFQFAPTSGSSNVISLLLWPAWLDLWILRAPGVLQSAAIGTFVTAALLYVSLTANHLRE